MARIQKGVMVYLEDDLRAAIKDLAASSGAGKDSTIVRMLLIEALTARKLMPKRSRKRER